MILFRFLYLPQITTLRQNITVLNLARRYGTYKYDTPLVPFEFELHGFWASENAVHTSDWAHLFKTNDVIS